MKKLILLFVLLLGSTMSLFAQDYQEVVYLKNGSIIRGVIIEQVPNVSLKIQTPDNSLFVCQMSEVEKITKELQDNSRSNRTRCKSTQSRNGFNCATKGYKGFAESAFNFGLDDHTSSRFELSTSHGYQFNPYIFLGAGLALNYYNDTERTSVPMFVDFRTNFLKKEISPVAEVKFGYTNGDIYGTYFSTSLGARFALSAKTALSVKLTYTYQADEDYDCSSGLYSSYRICSSESLEAIGLKVGFEF